MKLVSGTDAVRAADRRGAVRFGAVKLAFLCATLGACTVGAGTYWALAGGSEAQRREPTELQVGVEVRSVLTARSGYRADFMLDVPAGSALARFDIVTYAADLTASLRFGRPIDEDGEADFFAYSLDGRTPLRVGRESDPPIRPGRWYLRVEAEHVHASIGSDGRTRPVSFSLLPRVWPTGSNATLAIGTPFRGEIPARDSGFHTVRVDVPEGASVLRLDVANTDADIDLRATFGAPAAKFDASTWTAAHAYGRETLILTGRGKKPLSVGSWYIDVSAPLDDERPVRFELLATLSDRAPDELTKLPVLAEIQARAVPELARALCAVVELTTEDGSGSGTIVSESGWILTNAHVVEGWDGAPVDELVIACTLAAEHPAVELFRGRVERFDMERDLALVRVTSGFYGQSLPDGYKFPTLGVTGSREIQIGAPLWLVGYPATGGEGSRVTIHATRGVVAGFEHGALGNLIKTDASITQGNSGGAAVDAEGRFIGVPTSTVENGSGQSGFVRPIAMLPGEWLELVTRPR